MIYRSPEERRVLWRRRVPWIAALFFGFLACHVFDSWIVSLCLDGIDNEQGEWIRFERRFPGDSDWSRLFRITGFLPTWLFIGAAIILLDARHVGRRTDVRDLRFWLAARRGLPIVLAAIAGGLATELLKPIISRERPFIPRAPDELARVGDHVQHWPLSGFFIDYERGLGLPSSHAGVAFGGACALALLLPRLWIIAVPLAGGCAATRVLSTAHFLSDVYLAAVVGALAAWWIVRVLPPRNLRNDLLILDAGGTVRAHADAESRA